MACLNYRPTSTRFFILFLLFLRFISSAATAKRTSTFYLNKFTDDRLPVNHSCENMDCLLKKMATEEPIPKEFTICFRIMATTYQYEVGEGRVPVVTLGRMQKPVDRNETSQEFYGIYFSGSAIYIKTRDMAGDEMFEIRLTPKTTFYPQTWHHTCVSIQLSTQTVQMVENGVVSHVSNQPDLQRLVAQLEGVQQISVGCSYHLVGTSCISFHGMVADVHIFKRTLAVSEMISFTDCTDLKLTGDLLNWDSEQWKEGLRTQKLSLDKWADICSTSSRNLIHVPFLSNVPESSDYCRRLSGRIVSYENQEDLEDALVYISKKKFRVSNTCMRSYVVDYFIVWFGIKKVTQSNWINDNNKEKINFLPWKSQRPYVGDNNGYDCVSGHANFLLPVTTNSSSTMYLGPYNKETQLQMFSGSDMRDPIRVFELADRECLTHKACTVCEIDKPVRTIHVRGLCADSQLDKEFIYTIDDSGKPKLIGFKSSTIVFIEEVRRWRWLDRANQNSPESSASLTSLLLGVQYFEFSKPSEVCNPATRSKNVARLKFTTCKETEFTCHNGQCINLDLRCDQTADCMDSSDEVDCKMLQVRINYKKTIAPFGYDSEEERNVPVSVNVSLYIKDILKLDELDHLFSIKFTLILDWYDYRLTFLNLKNSRLANALSWEEAIRIWMPYIIFRNTENSEATSMSEKSEITVTKEGNYSLIPDYMMEETRVFEGRENKITFQQVYSKEFKCIYQLQMYPFDTQHCTLEMNVRDIDKATVFLHPALFDMEGDTVLTQYIVTFWNLTYINNEDKTPGVHMVVVMKRRIMNSLLTVYLPSLLVTVVVYCTNFFKPFFFEATVTVNLTGLLVLTTLFISVSGDLPSTSYIKWVDVWLLFVQMIPFWEVLLHTYIDYQRSDERSVNHHGKKIDVDSEGRIKNNKRQKRENLAQTLGIEDRLYHLDEREVIDARKMFYRNVTTRLDIVKIGEFTGRVMIPVIVLVFSLIYWAFGLSYYLASDSM